MDDSLMSEYLWNKTNITFTWLSSLYNPFKRYFDLLLVDKKGHCHYVLIKDFNTFLYNQTLLCDRKHFWCYCLQYFSAAQLLERHVNDCFEIDGKWMTKIAKKVKLLSLKTAQEK